MDKQFTISLQNRKIICSLLNKIPEELLWEIPNGFRNNLWWNMAHILAIQQILIYRFSGLPTRIEEQWVDRYKKGTYPASEPDLNEIEQLPAQLINTVVWAQEDYNKGLFKGYQEYTTSNKVTISSIEDAINFNNYHEGIHLGVILSQLKLFDIRSS
ncbi:MAG: DinB family protein [Flavobacteriaceae bacterium]